MSVMKHQGQGCGGHCCLKIEHLGVQIDGEDILRDVNLHIHCGEIAALIGPNGAGKSTLIRSILGQREHQGKITFQPAGGRSRKFRIGYVPQSPSSGHSTRMPRRAFFINSMVPGWAHSKGRNESS